MNVAGQFKDSVAALGRRRNLIFFFALAQAVFFVFGQWTVSQEIPLVMEMRERALGDAQNLAYLKPLTGFLAGSIALQVLYTFAFNLIFGAFLSTTLTGVVFFLPYMVAVWRGFLIGILTYGFIKSPGMYAAFYGTFILEFAGYSLSSAVGTDIGLALLWPARKRRPTRKEAVAEAIRDGSNIYFAVIALLFLAAIWEIASFHIVGPLF
ncbi:MAG: stage II sporulation protein M [Deltaproteobacteria bacterium]|nr:stage II sporulation protein M [Deltaproteobacteria bacterium]